MAIKIIMGTTYSGKSYFIQKHFQNMLKLDVYDYQTQVKNEQTTPSYEMFAILYEANERIKRDLVKAVIEQKDVVMEHTLFKCKRRLIYVDAIREVSNEPIEIYVMQPSDEQLRYNIQMRRDKIEPFFYSIKREEEWIEMPNVAEGFSKIYLVRDDVVEEYIAPANEEMVALAREELCEENMRLQKERERELVFQKAVDETKTKPFWHYCDGCGKKELLTSKQAFDNGWDYPGAEGIYKDRKNFGFRMLAPRTCGKCGVQSSVFWKMVLGKSFTEEDKVVLERMESEPMSLLN